MAAYDNAAINIFDVPDYDINENMWSLVVQLNLVSMPANPLKGN
jgi:hypothetical protein